MAEGLPCRAELQLITAEQEAAAGRRRGAEVFKQRSPANHASNPGLAAVWVASRWMGRDALRKCQIMASIFYPT